MNLRLRWTARALSRVEYIGSYIAAQNPSAAGSVLARIEAPASLICDHPDKGRAGRVAETRELVLADIPYIIVYRRVGNTIEILTVMHTSQRWP